MSQITRCPACRTSFRVVPDQLRISGGWVRCGHCKEVFDAQANLLPVETAVALAPASAPASVPVPAPVAPDHDWEVDQPHTPQEAPDADEPEHELETPESQVTAPSAPEAETGTRPRVWTSARGHASALNFEPADKGSRVDALVDPAPSQPWAGHFDARVNTHEPQSQPSQGGQGPDDSYGARGEANVVPPGWRPDADASASVPMATSDGPEAAPLPAADVTQARAEMGADPDTSPELETTPDADVAVAAEPAGPQWQSDEPLKGEELAIHPLTIEASAPAVPRADEPLLHTDPAPLETVAAQAEAESDELHAETPAAPLPASSQATEDEVGFMRAARRKAFWRKPVVRLVLCLLALLLLALLAGQYALAERDRIAARYPQVRPLLEKLCQPLQCEVGLPRQIAAIAIDSSTFTRVKDDPNSFRLQIALKSNADMPLEMPALEVTLTDAQDQPVLRRVLRHGDAGAPAELAAHDEWNGVISLNVPDVADRVAGYRLLAFYP